MKLVLPEKHYHYDPQPNISNTTFPKLDLSPDQDRAFKFVLDWAKTREKPRKTCTLAGLAGTGKSTLLSLAALELCNTQGKKVAFLAPTAKAASVLRRKLNILQVNAEYVGTVHGFMYAPVLDSKEELLGWSRRYFEKVGDSYVTKGGDIPKLDLIIVDEASMVHTGMEQDILAFGVPVLAVGDHGQLAPIQGVSSWMTRPDIKLEKIHRQAEDNPILSLAMFVRENGYVPRDCQSRYGISYFKKLSQIEEDLLCSYGLRGEHETAIVCYTNVIRSTMNEAIHRQIYKQNQLVNGSQVICLKNDGFLINGMRGFVRSEPELRQIWGVAEVFFPDDLLTFRGPFLQAQLGRSQPPKNVDEASALVGQPINKMEELGVFLDYGYVLTCHRCQGSQFQEVFVVLEQSCKPKDMKKWLYTAVTRAVEKLSFVEVW